MKEGPINIVIGGEAGQGLVTIGEILTRVLIRSGYQVCVTQSYMSRIRGGHNTFAIRAGTGTIEAPCECIDLLVALSAETLSRHKDEMSGRSITVTDAAYDVSDDEVLSVPFKELASRRYYNTAALGVAGAVLGIDEELVAQVLDEQFGKKHPEAVEENRKVLRKAYDWREGTTCSLPGFGKLKSTPPRLMLNGNQAIALGAISAGVRFASFYPMTPGTGISLGLISHASELGLVVEQAEDEISAVNMAIGASYAGVPSIVATSGGGFALMVEGVSLAGMIETPIVIAIAQRPGPATGLPTRTEQGDLELVLYAGHG
jgi:2-oxoglutarate ferredoxin oxidoreductase subunit alpha